MIRAFTAAVLIVVASSCSSNPRPSTERRPSSNILSQPEISTAPVSTAYDVLERLRPNFLRPHATGGRSNAFATVFIDGIRRGTLDVLRTVAANTIVEMRYLTAADATTRYGLDIEGGVIDVKLIRP